MDGQTDRQTDRQQESPPSSEVVWRRKRRTEQAASKWPGPSPSSVTSLDPSSMNHTKMSSTSECAATTEWVQWRGKGRGREGWGGGGEGKGGEKEGRRGEEERERQ